jgi:FixJ family two-component response regulator
VARTSECHFREASDDAEFMPKLPTTIGIVEDDPSMLRATEALLDAHGFATMSFSSAEEFLARGVASRIDCLVLDIHLGGISGIELLHRLKALGRDLPVIFMTAVENESVWRQAIKTGCSACLRKPLAAGQLVNAIAKATASRN